MATLSRVALEAIGFASLGDNVRVSDKVSVYNPGNISIGSDVRIDDFCVLSAGEGGIEIGNFVHIAAYSSLIGAGRITLSSFSNLSSRVSIYSSNDDYTGEFMTNPMVPTEFTNVRKANVHIAKHVIIGCGSVVLPGVTLELGAAVGALSLVNCDCEEFGIYAGSPVRFIKQRKRDLLEVEKLLNASLGLNGSNHVA
jgi:dTDP-4-amino-4,6-dideoxy-D-glucose acyltransferase